MGRKNKKRWGKRKRTRKREENCLGREKEFEVKGEILEEWRETEKRRGNLRDGEKLKERRMLLKLRKGCCRREMEREGCFRGMGWR